MKTWSEDEVLRIINEKGWLKDQKPIQNGMQFVLNDGTCVVHYSTGRVVVQGKATELKQEAQKLFDVDPIVRPTVGAFAPSDASHSGAPRRVFIVYGHDVIAREQLELLLRRLRLEPIVLQNVPAAGDTIIEKLEALTDADFACILLTPDDEGHRMGSPDQKKPRARQNVVLELGMVLARLGRRRVAVLVKGSNLERPSDIDGLIYLAFNDKVDEIKDRIAATLQTAGFVIQVADLLA